MKNSGADYTNCMRGLNRIPIPTSENQSNDDLNSVVDFFVSQCCSFKEYLRMNSPIVTQQQLQMMATLAQQQPDMLMLLGTSAEFVLNQLKIYEKQQQIKKESSPEKKKLQDETLWKNWIQLYRMRLWKEIEGEENDTDRKNFEQKHFQLMNSNNPKFILRNYLAQNAIEKAEKGDYSEVENLLNALRKPFEEKSPYDGIYDQVNQKIFSFFF